MPYLGKASKFLGPEYPGLPRVIPGYTPTGKDREWVGGVLDILDHCDRYNWDRWTNAAQKPE